MLQLNLIKHKIVHIHIHIHCLTVQYWKSLVAQKRKTVNSNVSMFQKIFFKFGLKNDKNCVISFPYLRMTKILFVLQTDFFSSRYLRLKINLTSRGIHRKSNLFYSIFLCILDLISRGSINLN